MGTQVGGLWGGLCGWSVVRCGSAEATVGLTWGVALLRNPDAGMTCLSALIFFFLSFFFRTPKLALSHIPYNREGYVLEFAFR